jgi:hypothetical protein
VPGALNVTVALPFGAIGWVSKVPPRSVAVCGRSPVLVKVTFVPAVIVDSLGAKSKSTISIPPASCAPAGRAGSRTWRARTLSTRSR